jgi:predicted dehydrogenase
MIRFKEAYIAEMIAFVNCVLNNTPPTVNADDAVKAFQIALAATKSAGDKQLVTLAENKRSAKS